MPTCAPLQTVPAITLGSHPATAKTLSGKTRECTVMVIRIYQKEGSLLIKYSGSHYTARYNETSGTIEFDE